MPEAGAREPQRPTIIKPTIGRIVWFNDRKGFPQVNAAIVTYVHSDSMVNLCVFTADGIPQSKTSVRLVQDGDEAPGYEHCFWMPYQKGQAAKAEGLASQIEALQNAKRN